jgi:thiol-disulfide isomerase/thioredoxin
MTAGPASAEPPWLALDDEAAAAVVAWTDRARDALDRRDPATALRAAIAAHDTFPEATEPRLLEAAALAALHRDAQALAALREVVASGAVKVADLEAPHRWSRLARRPSFRALLAEAAAAQAAAAMSWPEIDASEVASTPEALRLRQEEMEERYRMFRAAMSGLDRQGGRRWIDAWAAASWRALAASASGEPRAATFLLEGVRAAGRDVIGPLDPQLTPGRARAIVVLARDLVAAAPDSAEAQECQVLLAAASGRLTVQRVDDAGERGRAMRDYEASLLLILLAHPRSEAAREALGGLMSIYAQPHYRDRRSLLGRSLQAWLADDETLHATLRQRPGTRAFILLTEEVSPLALTTVSGATLRSVDLRGRVVVLVFWATWCGPCVADLPHLRDIHERLGPRGATVVGISLDEEKQTSRAELEAWLAEHGVGWAQAWDGEGFRSPLARSLGVRALPMAIVIDQAGRPYSVDYQGRRLVQQVEDLLAHGVPEPPLPLATCPTTER